ncbi:MAG: cytochrome c3 family protein [Pyrinomonadaceae bacterium]
MKVFIILAALIVAIILVSGTPTITSNVSAQDGKKSPEIIVLGKEAKLGQITFHHLDHVTKNRSVDGKSNIACVQCHHTAQPLAEALKLTDPPHKTVWPADRTTTLTADLFEKDATAPPVNSCRECHARTETKPTLLPEIPQMKGETEPIILTNQQALHRNCNSCHDAVLKARPDATAPGSKKCMVCHKKTATA